MQRAYCLVAVTLGLSLSVLHAQVPQLINYQGRIVTGGTNFHGAGQFKFALVNSTGLATFWSNDGTSVGGGEPTAAVSLGVSNGLYAVLLGNATLANMTVVPPTVFTNLDVRLRIWFNDGVTGFQQLAPDQRIAAVGYAMMSANVPDGIITSNKLAANAVTSAKIADGAITAAKLASNSVTSAALGDTVALGATNVSGRLDVYRTAAGTPAISLIGSSSQISTYGSDGLEQVRLYGTGWGDLWLMNSLSNNATAARLNANAGSGGYLGLYNSNGAARAFLSGTNSGGLLNLYQSDNQLGVRLEGDNSGSGLLSLYNTNGSVRVQLYGQGTGGGGALSLNNRTGQEVLELLAYTNGGALTLQDGAGVRAAELGSSWQGGGFSYLYNADGGTGLWLDGDSSGAGKITLYNTNASSRLTLQGQGMVGGGQIDALAGDGSTGVRIFGENNGGGGQIMLYNDSGTSTLYLYGDDGNAASIYLGNTAGNNRLLLDGYGSNGGGQISALNASGDTGVNVYGDSSGGGLVRLYNHNGSSTVSLFGDSSAAGVIYVGTTNGSDRLRLDGYGTGNGGQIYVYASDGSATINLQGDSGAAGLIEVRNDTGATKVSLDGENTSGGGEVTLRDSTGDTSAVLSSGSSGGYVTLSDDAGVNTVTWQSSGTGGGYGALYKSNGSSYGIYLDGETSGAGYLAVYGTNGNQVIYLDGQDADGNGRVVTQVLQITGGSDLSENFEINAPRALQPGMVVSIDAEHPGELRLSTGAYDRTVAGIISGAGGVSTGMLMGQIGTKADGKHPVALTGRVYCQADASNGAIQPGDLLTTSATPGHAMKVTDHARAQGAILGKAMTSLPSGQGLVLVLVSLQ
ncbi:MAG: hypothetical protein HZA90_20575 [Verrucomicrobia bacterium]|nr:hypothetical protein [Verrucomicrobiota bacterium]